jgi:hypothetical protein
VIEMADERDMALAAALRAVADAMVVSAARRAGAPEPIAQVAPTVVEGVAVAANKRRKRRASKYNREWAKARKEIDARVRTKSGRYRKGYSNARVMREAHKLAKRRMKR